MKNNLAVLLCFLSLFLGCRKENTPLTENENRESLSSMNEKIQVSPTTIIKEPGVFEIAESITSATKEAIFKEKVYQDIEKQFDGDYNVLIKDLISNQNAGLFKNDVINNKLGSLESEKKISSIIHTILRRSYFKETAGEE